MRIGYTVIEENIKYLKETCDKVIYIAQRKQRMLAFWECVTSTLTNDIVTYSIADLGLSLDQMTPSLEYLKQNDRVIYFLEKGHGASLSDSTYNDLLLDLARGESELAVSNGTPLVNPVGRPQTSQRIIDRISLLHTKEKRSIREIAVLCDVSIGTVHKYITLEAKNSND